MQNHLSSYAAAIRNFKGNPLGQNLHMASEGRLSTYYAPTEWINPKAKLVIVGITPGPTQAANALKAARAQLLAGASEQDTLRMAKLTGGFSGPLRKNLVDMLDHVGIHAWAGVRGCDELFSARSDLVQLASVLPYTVVVDGDKPYNGTPKLLRSPMLKSLLMERFLPSVQAIPNAKLLALGDVPFEALNWLADQGYIDGKRILGRMPHPGGANIERIKFFLGRIRPGAASVKCDEAKLTVMREHLMLSLAA